MLRTRSRLRLRSNPVALLVILAVSLVSRSVEAQRSAQDSAHVRTRDSAQAKARDSAHIAARRWLVDRGDSIGPPAIAREFRGAWVASVANIDWPSRPGLTSWEQQAELLDILNRAVELRLNAVVLQVRPAADALYESRHEPWSEYLTGQMGRAPEPFYDPLAFAVEQAHARGLELHAWFNPYRAHHPSAISEISRDHVSRTRPTLVRSYGRHLWLDPGDSAVRRHTMRVVLDVVRRYDVDGVHIDDYFYPYRERDSTGTLLDFPDDSTWGRYARARGGLSRDDWRRHNVDELVRRLYAEIKRVKPAVSFGVSPFGIWRPGSPPGITGFDAYEQIYADSRKWLTNGWLDYFAPQLYWPIADTAHSYPVLLRWWTEQNARGRHIWPGTAVSRVGAATQTNWSPLEIPAQIVATREQRGASGNIFFSMKALMRNQDGLSDLLRTGAYAEPALVPASPWLGGKAPARPRASVGADSSTAATVLLLRSGDGRAPWLWTVRARYAGEWTVAVLPGRERGVTLTRRGWSPEPDVVAVTAVGRTGRESTVLVLRRVER